MTIADDKLAELIRGSGEHWLLRIERNEDQSAALVRRRLDAAYDAYAQKFPDRSAGEPDFNDEAICAEYLANPHRVRALFQAIGASTPMMVALIWRVVQGDTIQQIGMRYKHEQLFRLEVSIKDELADRTADFTFDQIEDATFLRHLGIMRADNAPVFDGYYALNIPG